MQIPLHAGADCQTPITISTASIAPYIAAMLDQPPALPSLDSIQELFTRIWAEIEQQVKQLFTSIDTTISSVRADLAALFTEFETDENTHVSGHTA